MMSKSWLNVVALVCVFFLLIALVLLFQAPQSSRANQQEITYSQLLHSEKTIRDVTIGGNELSGHMVDNRPFMARLPADPAIATRLADAGIVVAIGEAPDPLSTVTLLTNGLSLLLSLLWLWALFRIARALERSGVRQS